jgi:hypothetical protein
MGYQTVGRANDAVDILTVQTGDTRGKESVRRERLAEQVEPALLDGPAA